MKTLAWLIGGAMLVLALTIAGVAAVLIGGAAELGELPTISINGEVIDLAGLGVEHAIAAAIAAAVALAVVLVVVCTVVPLALAAAGLAVTAALGLAALAVGGAALLVLSPAILIGFLVWRALRRTTIGA